MDRVHSTGNLPQRRWGSSAAQDQRSFRPTTASQRPVSGRPVSGYGNRLNSRMQSRPTTALTSQRSPPLFLPEPRPDSSAQVSGYVRPASSVRPLSGRIFLRKTQEKGWIAKSVPEISYEEGLEIEDYDDIYDDTESLDSFFDDDFDTEEQDEKLQRLLTCTTLGVASKGQKQDYVSGEVAVPKFHCPRCRDHYYGLTPYPCDEELSRLIREGLWRTGEGAASPDKSIRRGMMRASLSETNVQKNRKSSKEFSSSSKVKLPPLNANNSNMTSSNVTNQGNTDGSTSTSNRSKNRSKKISFALDNDSGASPSSSKTSLSGHGQDGSSDNKGRKRRIGDESKRGNLGPNKGSVTSLNDTDNAGSNSSLDKYRIAGRQKKSDNQSSTSKLIDNQTDAGVGDKGKGYNNGGNFSSAISFNNKNNSLGDETGHSTAKGLGTDASTGLNTDGSSTTMLIDQGTMTSSDNTADTGMGNNNNTHGSGSSAGDDNVNVVTSGGNAGKYGNKSSGSTDGSGKNCNVVNCQNKTNSKANAADSSGKKAQKAPPGYMRAASPSQSDWGDPTHAKKWINSVAPPHPTFRYNNDNDNDDDDFSSQVFNPRSWRQQKKPSKLDADDPLFLPVGPTFTRAFTFSYMPSSSAGTKASGSSRNGGKKSRKKTT